MSDSLILVVDDEERTRTFICDGLTTLGITQRAIGVSSAEAALAEADRSAVDLVISDVRMPGLNGLDLARQLHQTHPATPVILITGYSTRDIERAASALFVEALIKKPFGLDILANTVQAALQTAHLTRLPSVESNEVIQQQLNLLKRDSGAGWIGLLDATGSIVVKTSSIDAISSVVEAIDPRAWWQLTRSIANQSGAGFVYVERPTDDVYVINVEGGYFLALIYDQRWQASRIGAVWLSARQTADNLTRLLTNQPSKKSWSSGYASLSVSSVKPPIEP
jgi:CheY-like chemotaxis protein